MTTENILLEQQLAARRDKTPTAIRESVLRSGEKLVSTGLYERAIREGQLAPDFSLPDVNGQNITLSTLLANGPVVLTFYRGGWCPYCNMQLHAYEAILPQIKELGATLVAVSPQTPDNSLSTAEKLALDFEVLSDLNSTVIRRYGLVYTVDAENRKILAGFGNDLRAVNGNDKWELPVPGTFVIDRDGIVRLAFVEPDYTKRLEPALLIKALQKL